MLLLQYMGTHKKTAVRGIVYGIGLDEYEGLEKILPEYRDVFFTGKSSQLSGDWE